MNHGTIQGHFRLTICEIFQFAINFQARDALVIGIIAIPPPFSFKRCELIVVVENVLPKS